MWALRNEGSTGMTVSIDSFVSFTGSRDTDRFGFFFLSNDSPDGQADKGHQDGSLHGARKNNCIISKQ